MDVGDRVDYHSIIGGPITSYGHQIRSFGVVGSSGVAWITGKSGGVALTALSPAVDIKDIPIDPLLQLCSSANKMTEGCEHCINTLTRKERKQQACYTMSGCPECMSPVDKYSGTLGTELRSVKDSRGE